MNNEIRKICGISKMFYELSKAVSKCCSDHSIICDLKVNEGLIRTAVSRAYYAVFFIAREALGLRNIGGPEVRARIIDELHEDGLPDLANKIRYLRGKRNHADYPTYFYISPKEFEKLIRTAEKVISGIRERYSMPRRNNSSNHIII